ncbi:hypothetical protein ENBRE01_2690 [Enteropsectra breve]|nr:hypothetical protein ENBRE01_2690 [Enteropsectra breve]
MPKRKSKKASKINFLKENIISGEHLPSDMQVSTVNVDITDAELNEILTFQNNQPFVDCAQNEVVSSHTMEESNKETINSVREDSEDKESVISNINNKSKDAINNDANEAINIEDTVNNEDAINIEDTVNNEDTINIDDDTLADEENETIVNEENAGDAHLKHANNLGPIDEITYKNSLLNFENFNKYIPNDEIKKPITKNSSTKFTEDSLSANKMQMGKAMPMPTKSFPGSMYLIVSTINGYNINSQKSDERALSIITNINDTAHSTSLYREESDILIDQCIRIPLQKEQNKILAKVFINGHIKQKTSPWIKNVRMGECSVVLDKAVLPLCNNMLYHGKFPVIPCREGSFFSRIKNLFRPRPLVAESITVSVAYISDDQEIAIRPESLYMLKKLLIIKRNEYNLLYAGHIEIKAFENLSLDEHAPKELLSEENAANKMQPSSKSIEKSFNSLEKIRALEGWKRFFVKWFGYKIQAFDPETNREAFAFNLENADIFTGHLNNGIISFDVRGKRYSLYCNTMEKLHGCLDAMDQLFIKTE